MVVKKQKRVPHIKKEELNIGVGVILLPDHYVPTQTYPVWGSEYSCTGTIVEIQHDVEVMYGKKVTFVRISWSSGTYGLYKYNAIALASNVNTDDPNIGYKVFRKEAR